MSPTLNVFTEALNKRYGPSNSAEEYSMKAQVQVYEAHRAMMEAYGRNKYTSTGIIQWMLNNAWPSMIWHLYDWYLRPGGSYFGVKKACEPLHVQYSYYDQSIVILNSNGPLRLLRGYELALRPKLMLGRFRSPASEIDEMLVAIRDSLAKDSIRWSITGAPAAYRLQKFYRGLELPIFIESLNDQLRRRSRIIPDKSGPLIFLRSVSSITFWRESGSFPIAHPWLIYSELMYSSDSRAHEAAEEIKREYLSE
ncbi:MAG: type IV toxin-antitoxin system AbiEi family antitoxin [Candidatus Sulfotelmatobacter sp.]